MYKLVQQRDIGSISFYWVEGKDEFQYIYYLSV